MEQSESWRKGEREVVALASIFFHAGKKGKKKGKEKRGEAERKLNFVFLSHPNFPKRRSRKRKKEKKKGEEEGERKKEGLTKEKVHRILVTGGLCR